MKKLLIAAALTVQLFASSGSINWAGVADDFGMSIYGDFEGNTQIFVVYLDTDKNPSTGYSERGADYMIRYYGGQKYIHKYINENCSTDAYWEDGKFSQYWENKDADAMLGTVYISSAEVDEIYFKLKSDALPVANGFNYFIETYTSNWQWQNSYSGSHQPANINDDEKYVYQNDELDFYPSYDKKNIGITRKQDSRDLINTYTSNTFYTHKNDSINITHTIENKTGGFDVQYTITNNQNHSVELPILQISGIKFGDTNDSLNILNPLFKHYLEKRSLLNEKEYVKDDWNGRDEGSYFNVANSVRTVFSNDTNETKTYEEHYPYGSQFVYSPVIVATNNDFAVGVSLNLNYMQREYRLKPLMSIVKNGADWEYKYDLRDSKIMANTALTLTLSVRFAKSEKWIFTLYPYKNFLNEYLVKEDRNVPQKIDLRPIQAIQMSRFDGNDSIGDGRYWSEDVLNPEKNDMNLTYLLQTRGVELLKQGFQRAAFWNFTGLYSNNNNETVYGEMSEQLPFQFVSRESPILPENMSKDMKFLENPENNNDNPFNQLSVGYDWGISGNIPIGDDKKVLGVKEWQPYNIVKFDIDNQSHKDYAKHYLNQAKNLKGLFKPKFIRLDAFQRMDKDEDEAYGYGMSRIKWLKQLQANLPDVTFAVESSIDYMHARTADILQPDSIFAWKGKGTQSEHNISKPNMLAKYLNPGAETYVWINANNLSFRKNIEGYIKSLVANGYTPLIDHWEVVDANVSYLGETIPKCMDGKDNDGDGKIDWPYDAKCSTPADNSEN